MMDMAHDNAVVPEETLGVGSSAHHPSGLQTQTHTQLWAEHHRLHDAVPVHDLSAAAPVSVSSSSQLTHRHRPQSSTNNKGGSLRALLHQVTKLFVHSADDELKGPAHYRRGSILIKHLEDKRATGVATDSDLKFFEMVKSHFDANILESRTIISLSVFQTGSNPMNDPFAVIHMPVIIQQGFRRKLFAIFTLQLFAVVILLSLFSYPPAIVETFEPVFTQWHYTFVAFVAMVGMLLWLYLVKYKFPLNFAVLAGYTVTQSVFFAGCDYLFDTKASLFIFGFLLAIMTLTTGLCTIVISKSATTTTADATSTLPQPKLISFPVVILIGYFIALLGSLVVYFGFMDDAVSLAQYGASLAAMLLLVLWFAYDATCMNERLSPDEYMQGMVFFYTDMVLFLLFLSIIFVACFACEGDCACYGTADIAPIGGGGDDDDDDDGGLDGDGEDGGEDGELVIANGSANNPSG